MPNGKVGVPTYYLVVFPKNCMKMNRTGVLETPSDPPMARRNWIVYTLRGVGVWVSQFGQVVAWASDSWTGCGLGVQLKACDLGVPQNDWEGCGLGVPQRA